MKEIPQDTILTDVRRVRFGHSETARPNSLPELAPGEQFVGKLVRFDGMPEFDKRYVCEAIQDAQELHERCHGDGQGVAVEWFICGPLTITSVPPHRSSE